MLTKEQTEGIVEAFKKEACDFLGIDSSSIQVKYTYLHQSMKGYFISNHEDTIIVDKQFLDKCISSKSMPPLRFDIYVKTKLIHERRSNKSEFNQNDHETIYKSTLYASAIMILKGLCLHITKSYNNKKLLDGIKSTLNTEFGFDGDFFKIPSKPDSKYNFYKFRLNFIEYT